MAQGVEAGVAGEFCLCVGVEFDGALEVFCGFTVELRTALEVEVAKGERSVGFFGLEVGGEAQVLFGFVPALLLGKGRGKGVAGLDGDGVMPKAVAEGGLCLGEVFAF